MDALNVTCINGTNINCTGNATCMPCGQKCFQGDCELDDLPLSTYAKVRIIVYIIALLLSLLGNGCVILVTLQTFFAQKCVTAFKLLITHLAFVDLLFSCNSLVLIPNETHNAESDDGLPMCTFKRMLRQTPLTASIGTITIIAIERYVATNIHGYIQVSPFRCKNNEIGNMETFQKLKIFIEFYVMCSFF